MNWIRILYSLQFLVFIVIPCLYKSRRPSMLAFYDSMIWRKSARRFYTLTFFLFLICFHFYYLTIFKNHYEVIPSTALCYVLLSHKWFEKIMRSLQIPQVYFCALLITVTCLFLSHFFTLGVSFGVIMIATLFYPAQWWDRKKEDINWIDKVYFEKRNLNRVYFSWKDPEEKKKVKTEEGDDEVELMEAEEVINPELPFMNTDIEDADYKECGIDEWELEELLNPSSNNIEFRRTNLIRKENKDELR